MKTYNSYCFKNMEKIIHMIVKIAEQTGKND